MRTVNVDKSKYTDYLKKSEEYKRSMESSFERGDWNSCVGNSVHCAILAADALCIIFLGVRHRGENHEEAIGLFRSISPNDERMRKNAQRLGDLLSVKTDAEYGEKLLTSKEAELSIQTATRFLDFIKERISEVV